MVPGLVIRRCPNGRPRMVEDGEVLVIYPSADRIRSRDEGCEWLSEKGSCNRFTPLGALANTTRGPNIHSGESRGLRAHFAQDSFQLLPLFGRKTINHLVIRFNQECHQFFVFCKSLFREVKPVSTLVLLVRLLPDQLLLGKEQDATAYGVLGLTGDIRNFNRTDPALQAQADQDRELGAGELKVLFEFAQERVAKIVG